MGEATLAKGGGDRHTRLLCGSFPVVSQIMLDSYVLLKFVEFFMYIIKKKGQEET